MARWNRKPSTKDVEAALANARPRPNAVVAAATRVKSRTTNAASLPVVLPRQPWALEAWRQYDICGELRFATNWLANSVSRCRLTVVDVGPDGTIGHPTKNTDVINLTAPLLGNPSAQAGMLRDSTTNLTIAGDYYLLIESSGNDGDVLDTWCVLSGEEVSMGVGGGFAMINLGDETLRRTIDLSQVLLFRVHRPHPRMWWWADSPTHAALPILRELEEFSKYLFATINSRIGGAGILLMPSEMDFPNPDTELAPGQTAFSAAFEEAIMDPIEDMGDPAALVPVIVQAPGETLGNVKWVTNPNGDLPPVISQLRKDAIQRLALSLDLAPEQLLGSANANHWGQWSIEEQSIKFHIEPVMILICAALNTSFLAPLLEAAGIDPTKFMVWYDASDLIQSPNRGVDAKDLYDRYEISGAALRRETGFAEDDAPTGEELCLRNLMKLISIAPQVAGDLLPELAELMNLGACGIDLSKIVADPNPEGTAPQDNPPDPNKDPKALPPKPVKEQTPPNKDGTTPESKAA